MGHLTVSVTTTIGGGRLHLAWAFLRNPRSPEWGLAGQGLRYAICGGLVAVLYATVTTVLHEVLAVPFQIALAAGFGAALALHFTLQRTFVWRHHERFALAMHHQVARYVLVCSSQYGLTALTTSRLPGPLGLPVEAVYLMTMFSLTGINFVLFRGRVFHPISVTEGKAA
jgi:putative flippase GtrA